MATNYVNLKSRFHKRDWEFLSESLDFNRNYKYDYYKYKNFKKTIMHNFLV